MPVSGSFGTPLLVWGADTVFDESDFSEEVRQLELVDLSHHEAKGISQISGLPSLLLSSRSRSSDVVGLVQSRDEHGEESTGDEEHLMSYFAPSRNVLLEIMLQQLQ